MSSISLATRFKIGLYMLNRENVTCPKSTDIIQVVSELLTDNIKVS